MKCGFRQGCGLSALLFIIFMDNIIKRANQEENIIEELMFADDLVLIAEDHNTSGDGLKPRPAMQKLW